MSLTLLVECAENVSGVTDSYVIRTYAEMHEARTTERDALNDILTVEEAHKLRRFFTRAYRDMKMREFPEGTSRAHMVRTFHGPVFYYATRLTGANAHVI